MNAASDPRITQLRRALRQLLKAADDRLAFNFEKRGASVLPEINANYTTAKAQALQALKETT